MTYAFANPPDDPLQLDGDGNPIFGMGLLPSEPDKGGLPQYGASNPIIPRSQWKPISFRAAYPAPVRNQKTYGACVAFASAKAFKHCWMMAGGTDHTFAEFFLYSLINGGRDGGASIVAALQAIQEDGLALEDQVPFGTIQKSRISSQAFETAKRFKAKGYVANSRDELGSGVQLGFMPVYGVAVGGAFQGYDGHGLVRQSGFVNHAVTADGMHYDNGQWIFDGNNSWGEGWGNQGNFDIALDSIHEGEMYLIQYVLDDPQETNLPPVLT